MIDVVVAVVVVAPTSLDCRTEKLPEVKRKMVLERIVFAHFIPILSPHPGPQNNNKTLFKPTYLFTFDFSSVPSTVKFNLGLKLRLKPDYSRDDSQSQC